MVKLKQDGSLAWAKTLGTNEDDGVKVTLMANMVAQLGWQRLDLMEVFILLDEHRSRASGTQGAILFKVTSTGDLAWSQVWRPHWNPQMNGEAWGSVVAVSGNKVYLAGAQGPGRPVKKE